jgi:glycerophosphoryl diester phosphodiesterase
VAAENTIEAFRLALDQGADGVELDVHRTSDGRLVVHHDAVADRLGVLAARTLEEIRGARPEIPTLDEALDACAGSLVNIEVKNLPGDADYDPEEQAAALVVDVVVSRGRRDNVLVSSFNLATIDHLRAADESIPTAFLVMFGFEAVDALALCHSHGHGSFHPFVGLLAGEMAAQIVVGAHELGVRVNTWTVNDDDEVRRLAAAGIDGIVTDVPDAAIRALRA